MKTYTAIIKKENKAETEIATVVAKSLVEAKDLFSKMGRVICYGGGRKIYF